MDTRIVGEAALMASSSPATWQQALAAPAYVVNLDRRPDRLLAAIGALRAAGFSNVTRFAAVDGRDHDALAAAWAAVGRPELNEELQSEPGLSVGQQGCLLSHLLVWEHIARQPDPFAWVFEDDIKFAPCWPALAPAYFARSRPPWDILYAGSHAWLDLGHAWLVRVPVYCLHAYLLTRTGARALSATIRSMEITVPLDMLLADRQRAALAAEREAGFDWLVWHAQHHHGIAGNGATGLVLQDRENLPSDIPGSW